MNNKIFGLSCCCKHKFIGPTDPRFPVKTKKPLFKFDFALTTDGVGCSLQFINSAYEKPNYCTSSPPQPISDIKYLQQLDSVESEKLRWKQIVCGDPGLKTNLYLMNDEGVELRRTAAQHDTESLAKRNRRIKKSNKKRNSKSCEFLNQQPGATVQKKSVLE